MKLKLQIMQDRFVKTTYMQEIDIEHMIENPAIGIEKDDLVMFNCWINETGIRDSKNITSLSTLVLDYDCGFSIAEFMMRYYKFRFYLYTSSSHTPQKNKFRVIIPLEREILINEYTKEMRLALEKYFKECDKTAFYKDHPFFIPAKKEENEYIYKINYGRLFDIEKELRNLISIEKMKTVDNTIRNDRSEMYRKSNTTFKDLTNEITKKFYDGLKEADGERYVAIFKLVGKYKRHYFDLLYDLLENCNLSRKNIKTLQKELQKQ